MKVALVHEFLTQYGGAERVLEAIHELFPKAPVYTMVYDKAKTGQYFGSWDLRTSFLQNMPLGVKKFKWYLSMMPKATESFDLSEYDLIISDASAFAKGVITNKEKQLHICYCHTPTRYLWSETEFYLKTAGIPWPVTYLMPSVIKYLRKWDYKAAQRPDFYLANSKVVKERIKKYYNRESEIIYPFVDASKFQPSETIGDYYLLAGRIVPYKRYDIVIEAFNNLDLPLKVVGSGYGLNQIKKLAKSSKIEFLGRVSDDELKKIFSQTKAFIFPAFEDFGIVPLEAMAAGRPVIAYGEGGVLETIKEGVTGEFFKEQTPQSLAQAVNKFDVTKYNSQIIRQHAITFDKPVFNNKLKKYIDQKVSNRFNKNKYY